METACPQTIDLFGPAPQAPAPEPDGAGAVRQRVEDAASEYRALLDAGLYGDARAYMKRSLKGFDGSRGSAHAALGSVRWVNEEAVPDGQSVRDKALTAFTVEEWLHGVTSETMPQHNLT